MSDTDEEQPTEDKDWLLQQLVKMANDGMRIGITLQMGGFLVSGILIPGDEYFEKFAEDWASGFEDKELIEPIRERFAKSGSIYKTENPDRTQTPMTIFIHLKHAKFYQPGGAPIPKDSGVLWRGRISYVAGFTLGNLSPATS